MEIDNSQTFDGPTHRNQPIGTYPARAVEWQWDTDRNGVPCLAIRFAIEGESFNGYQINGRLYFDTDKADKSGRTTHDRSMRALRAMGLRGPLQRSVVGIDAGLVDLVIEANDRGYAAIKYINAPGGGERELKVFNAPQDHEIDAFLARLNARESALAARAHASGTQPVQGSRPQPRQQPPQSTQATQGGHGGQRPQQATQQPAQGQQTRQGSQGGQTRQTPPRMPAQGADDFGSDDVPF